MSEWRGCVFFMQVSIFKVKVFFSTNIPLCVIIHPLINSGYKSLIWTSNKLWNVSFTQKEDCGFCALSLTVLEWICQYGQEEQLQQPRTLFCAYGHVGIVLRFESIVQQVLKVKTWNMLSWNMYFVYIGGWWFALWGSLTHPFVYHCITASNDAAISVDSCPCRLACWRPLCILWLQGKSNLNQERCHCYCLRFSTSSENRTSLNLQLTKLCRSGLQKQQLHESVLNYNCDMLKWCLCLFGFVETQIVIPQEV